MLIQLIDKDGWRSPVLYIHSDEDEFMEQINLWLQEVRQIIKDYPSVDGLPLGRLDPETCMFDLARHLGNYYVESTPLSFAPAGHVYGCLKIFRNEDEIDEEIVEINLHEEETS
jgi:hypothetical protein